MNLDFDYKICELKNYLTEEEMISLDEKVMSFDVDLSEIKSTLGFLCWSEKVQSTLKEKDLNRYEKIINNNFITYEDYKILNEINELYKFGYDDYFNFFLTYSNDTFKNVGIYEYIQKTYIGILKTLFDKDLREEHKDTLIGNINIYPKGSFIRKHQDNDPDGQRLFTLLFFLNSDRTIEQGSILKLYTKDEPLEIIPNFKKCILIEHQNYNYIHEVTQNLVDDVRYSIYSPFTIKDYKEKLIHN